MRAKSILELPLEFIDNPEFHRRGAFKRVVETPMPEPEHTPRRVRPPAGLPRYLASLYEVPLLTREQEYYLFRKFNFLKFKAAQLRENLDVARAKASEMNEIQDLYDAAVKGQEPDRSGQLATGCFDRQTTRQCQRGLFHAD